MTHLLLGLLMAGAWGSEVLGGLEFHFGDPHVHTGASADGGSTDVGDCTGSCGAVADLSNLAADEGLDWIAVTDHVNGPDAARAQDFAFVLQEVLAAGEDGGLVTVPGAELWIFQDGHGPLGHRNLYLFGSDEELASLTIEDVRFQQISTTVSRCSDAFSWLHELETELDQPLLLIPHHPAAMQPRPVDWSCHDPELEPAVEVYSEHGSSMGDGEDYDPVRGGELALHTVHRALEHHGHHLGFMAGTDRHDTHPGAVCELDSEHSAHPYGGGLTAVVLEVGEPLDREAIHDAITEHRTYATSGPRLAVSVRYSSAGAPLGRLGDDLAVPVWQPLQVDVELPLEHHDAITRVVAVTPGAEHDLERGEADTWSVTLTTFPAWVYVRVEVDGTAWYTQACEDGGEDAREMVWLSPSWWVEGRGDLDGDGQTWARGDCHDGDPEVYLGAFERCGEGRDVDCDGLLDHEDPDCTGAGDPPPGPVLQAGPIWDVLDDIPPPEGGASGALTEPSRPGGCASAPASAAWLLWVPLLGLRRRTRPHDHDLGGPLPP